MGDGYKILVSQEIEDLLHSLDEKSERIIRENLSNLSNPYPGEGSGDKKRISGSDTEIFRFHIGRTWTAFYTIDDDENVVRVLRVMPIDDAHKEYGEFD